MTADTSFYAIVIHILVYDNRAAGSLPTESMHDKCILTMNFIIDHIRMRYPRTYPGPVLPVFWTCSSKIALFDTEGY